MRIGPALLIATLFVGCSSPPEDEADPTPTPTPLVCVPTASPDGALIDTPITLYANTDPGCSFGDTPGTLRFGFQEVPVTSWTNETIGFVVPSERWPMTIAIYIDRAGDTTIGFPFDVLAPEVLFVNAHSGNANAVAAFSITGPILGSPFLTAGAAAVRETTPRSILAYPIGNTDAFHTHVFAANDDSIAVFSEHGTTGVLVPVAGSPFPSGSATGGLLMESTASGPRLLAASCDSGDVRVFAVSSNAILSEVDDSPFPTTSACPTWIFSLPTDDTSEKRIYVGGTSGRFDAFTMSLGTSGTLTPAPSKSFDLPTSIYDVEPYRSIETWHALVSHRGYGLLPDDGVLQLDFDDAGDYVEYDYVVDVVNSGTAVIPTAGDITWVGGPTAYVMGADGYHNLHIYDDEDVGDPGSITLPELTEAGTIADVSSAFGESGLLGVTDRGTSEIHVYRFNVHESTFAMGTATDGRPAGIAW